MAKALIALLGLLLAASGVPARAAEYALAPDQIAVGAVAFRITRADETLLDIAREYDVGYVQLIAANPGVDPWLPGAGKKIVIPSYYILPDAPRLGIVVNLAERRIFYFPSGGGRVMTFPAGIGVRAGSTPLGSTQIVRKETAPVWIPPPSIRAENPDVPVAVGPGPNNPLGQFALRLGWTNYLIHGTNKPDSVGRNVSHGCLHLYPEDIETLFRDAPIGTPVRVIDQPVEAAWIGGRLLVEVHASRTQADDIDNGHAFTPAVPQELLARVAAVAGNRADLVDWKAVRRAGLERTGLPSEIAQLPPDARLASDAD